MVRAGIPPGPDTPTLPNSGSPVDRLARRALHGARSRLGHHPFDAVALLLEAREHRPLEHPAAWQLDAHRVDEPSIDEDFVVHVGAGRLAGRADKADHLALADARARLHAASERRHVAVGG